MQEFLFSWYSLGGVVGLIILYFILRRLGAFTEPSLQKVPECNFERYELSFKAFAKGSIILACGAGVIIFVVSMTTEILTLFDELYLKYPDGTLGSLITMAPALLFFSSVVGGITICLKGVEVQTDGEKCTKSLPLLYQPDVRYKVSLPERVNGIISVRSWRVKRGVLYSEVVAERWVKSEVICDYFPDETNECGIYAHSLTMPIGLLKLAKQKNCVGVFAAIDKWMAKLSYSFSAVGIVEQTGSYILHEDGVVRSERCRILLLLVSEREKAERLSSVYGVPVVFDENYGSLLSQWLSENTKHYAEHNKEIFNGNTSKDKKERVCAVS